METLSGNLHCMMQLSVPAAPNRQPTITIQHTLHTASVRPSLSHWTLDRREALPPQAIIMYTKPDRCLLAASSRAGGTRRARQVLGRCIRDTGCPSGQSCGWVVRQQNEERCCCRVRRGESGRPAGVHAVVGRRGGAPAPPQRGHRRHADHRQLVHQEPRRACDRGPAQRAPQGM